MSSDADAPSSSKGLLNTDKVALACQATLSRNFLETRRSGGICGFFVAACALQAAESPFIKAQNDKTLVILSESEVSTK